MRRIVLPTRPRRRARIDVVIPCYNYGHFLEGAVASVLAQADVDARVVIVDDASPDGSGAVARRIAAREPRVRAVVHVTNRGHIASYNDGFRHVDADYVTLVSADDVVAPGALGRAVALMERYPRVGLVYGPIATFADDRDDLPRRAHRLHLWRIWGRDDWVDAVARSGYNPIASPEAVLRTIALRQVGGYNPALPHSGDLEYWLRIAARWDVGQIHGPVQAYYRVHGRNMHLTDFGAREIDVRERIAAFGVLSDAAVLDHLPAGRRHLRTARRSLVAQIDELLHDGGADAAATTSLWELRIRLDPDTPRRRSTFTPPPSVRSRDAS